MTFERLAEYVDGDPDFDGTDVAHPAWWRGSDYGVAHAARILLKAIDGTDGGGGVCASADLEYIRRWILAHR